MPNNLENSVRLLLAGLLITFSMACTSSPPTDTPLDGPQTVDAAQADANTIDARPPTDAAPDAAQPTVVQVAAGMMHTCAMLSDGRVRCWGNNGGLLGNGSAVDSPVPVSTQIDAVLEIDGGWMHNCARRSGGVHCWGWVARTLGNGGAGNPLVPTLVQGVDGSVTDIDVGSGGHACAIAAGTLRCWGVGIGPNGYFSEGEDALTAVAVSGLGSVTSVSAGGSARPATCVIQSGGALKCWGADSQGQVGNGTVSLSVAAPTPIALANVRLVSSGYNDTVAVTTDGIYAWGGINGETRPRRVSTQILTTVSAGGGFACGISPERRVLCFGRNSDGQLGDGTLLDRSTPVMVQGLQNVDFLAVGYSHACAVSAGVAWCWGNNSSGQLGTTLPGGATMTSTPVRPMGI